jgi:hypothetical protein
LLQLLDKLEKGVISQQQFEEMLVSLWLLTVITLEICLAFIFITYNNIYKVL